MMQLVSINTLKYRIIRTISLHFKRFIKIHKYFILILAVNVKGCSSSDCTMVTIEEENIEDENFRENSETNQFWGER